MGSCTNSTDLRKQKNQLNGIGKRTVVMPYFALFLISHRRYCHVVGWDVQRVPLIVIKAGSVQECLFERTGCISGERKSNYSCATIKSE